MQEPLPVEGSQPSLVWRVLRFFNTFAITILSCAVAFLFVQLQYVNYSLQKEQDSINDLIQQMQSQQTEEINQLNEKVEQEHSYTLYQLAGTFTLIVALMTIFHISSHLRNYHEPLVQRKIVTILWMSPIYAITSFCSLVFPVADGYLAIVRDFYEAYTVYTFLSFLIAVLARGGTRDTVVEVLGRHADHLKAPTRLLSAWYHPAPDTSPTAKANAVLLECQILALQFVFFRPLTSLANFVVSTVAEESNSYWTSPHLILDMITNLSVFLAFTGLLKFYHAVREDLLWCQPFAKFMAIKGIVFLTFWQGLLITILVHWQWDDDNDSSTVDASMNNSTRFLEDALDSDSADSAHEQASRIQNVLICLEMLLFSIAHWCVFPAEEWEPDYRPKEYAKPGIGLKDFASDVGYLTSSLSQARQSRRLERESASWDEGTEEDAEIL